MSILYVDDEPAVSMIVEHTLRDAGHETVGARNVPEALQVLARGGVELIISDYKMPGLSGLEFLELLTSEGFDIPLIMLTGYASIEHAVASIKAGAVDYITKPVRPEQLTLAVEQALELVRLRKENATLRREMSVVRNERQILGDSAVMRHALQSVATAAPTRATVLLLGESGTGKELFARAIHDMSDRHDKPFIKLNCAALPEGLIESALFGHEKGAFTGADTRKTGLFELAAGGTLFLDEIAEMPFPLQVKLLRVLQERKIRRLGGTRDIPIAARIISATNKDIESLVRGGGFREDLYYRLNVVRISVPPLRDRREDIPLLAGNFLEKIRARAGRGVKTLAPDALEALMLYSYPGNIRELSNILERAVITSEDDMIMAADIALDRFPRTSHAAGSAAGSGRPLKPMMELERDALVKALEKWAGNRTKAAEELGISRRTILNKIKQYGL